MTTTIYLKPDAIIALHYLNKAESLSYSVLEDRLNLKRAEVVALAKDLYSLGLIEYLVMGISISTQGKWALKLGTVEK